MKFAHKLGIVFLLHNAQEKFMGKDYRKMDAQRCYACLQWDGERTLDKVKRLILVDDGKESNCRLLHKKVKGSSSCDKFYQLT
jgi:hypothetical protein